MPGRLKGIGRPLQMGTVVEDLEKAMEYFTTTFGWGPWTVRDYGWVDVTYRGKKGRCLVRDATFPADFAHGFQIELTTAEGDHPIVDFLKERGEGLNHCNFGMVDDLDAFLADAAEKGFEPIFDMWFTEPVYGLKLRSVFLNTEKIGGIWAEVSGFQPGESLPEGFEFPKGGEDNGGEE